MFRLIMISLLAVCAFALEDKDLNGRWDITVHDQTRRRAWWMEVKGADTAQPSGSFIGAPGGGLDQFKDLRVERGELRWSFGGSFRVGKGEWKNQRKGMYEAKLVDKNKMEGVLKLEGEPAPIAFTAVRAPKLKPVAIESLKKGEPVELFNGRDLSGWRPLLPERKVEWTVADGVTKNVAGAVDLVSEAKFTDFLLHAEYKVGPGSNSGIGLRARYEVQILDDFGQPADIKGHGSIYSRIKPSANASKPVGEWQTLDASLAGNRVTVTLNGTTIIKDAEIEGLTAIAVDPNEGQPGPIIVQGDHGAVEFRKLTITPLIGR